MLIKIILTTMGAHTGPQFLLFSDVDGYVSAFDGPINKSEFLPPDGYVTEAPEGTQFVLVRNYGGICDNDLTLEVNLATSTTSTSSTTVEPSITTTTSSTTVEPGTTTTSSTTMPPVGINIANNSDDQYIAYVTIGAISPVPLVGGDFPLAPGNMTTAYTDLTGVHQINVHFTNISTGVGSIVVVDADTTVTCVNFTTWDDPLEFYFQNIQITPIMTITANAIVCETTTSSTTTV